MPARSPDSLSHVEELFADWLSRREGDGSEDLESLCRDHPGEALELRQLSGYWERLRRILERAGIGPGPRSLAEKIQEEFGSGVDPNVSLDAGDAPVPPSDALLRRLAEHTLKSPRYKLQEEIARGGMGAILRVWDEDLRRSLAMKVILGKAEPTSEGKTPPVDRRLLARFLEEAQVTGQLDHPGIVPVHELGLDSEGRVFFTMKLVKGRDLKQTFDLVFEEKEGWNETRALGVILKVCEAMAYAHAKGVVHRDLKPANIMVGNFGEVYVMDWGLARVLGREDRHDLRLRTEGTNLTSVKTERREECSDSPDSPILTRDGDIVGTPAYMPPEQARGEVEKIGPHSDVYAIGAVIYHLLARQMPFVPLGARITNRMILGMVVQGPPAQLTTLRKDIPAELVAICEKAMAREPSKRYRDTLEIAEDLRAYLERRVVKAYRTGALVELKKWIERNKGLATASAAAVLALVAGVVTSLSYASRAAEKSKEALREARRADDKATEARRLENEAVVREATATARADALWAIEELKHFETLDDDLEYARSQDRPSYVWWLEQAHALVDGCPEDPVRGSRKKPGLQDHRRLLERIRSEARPPTEAELAADRASHPKGKELETKRAELIWTSRMLGLEPWPSEAEVEASLAREGESADAGYLNDRAWNLVDPDARVLGREIEALVLARRAVDSAQDNSRARYRDTLAWALLWAGMIDEALAEEQRAIEEVDPEERADFERYLLRMDGEAQPFRDGTAHGRQQTLVAEVSALEQEVAERQAFHFADREKEWWNMQLGGLLQDLEELGKRILLAERSVGSPAALQQWNEAIEAIARSPKYSGLRLTPQLELVPLGPDPDSGLWEFAHLATGEPARRGTDGFLLKPETGIVFVLLPAGRAPVENGSKPRPMNEVLLDPFFLSKYEMTVAQWQRTSHWTEGFWLDRPLLPASGVSWDDCVATLTRAGLFLRLPTEAQWEYGCRAGTTTVWWTGAEEETLWGAANIDFDPEDDEEVELERVGQLLANPFGLHDVHGNVAEWCRDEYCLVDAVVRAGDGEFAPRGARNRVARGGGFPLPVSLARSGGRLVLAPDSRTVDMAPPIRTQLGENIAFESRGGVGLRVARGITP